MTTLFDAVQQSNNTTETLNGRRAYKTSFSNCLDLFYQGSSLRNDKENLTHHVLQAFKENPLLTLRMLFYFRDIRGNGQGERNIFRIGLSELIKVNPTAVLVNLKYIPEFGRWDDLFSLFGLNPDIDQEISRIVREQADKDLDSYKEDRPNDISLMWKWLPSENASSPQTIALASKIRKSIFNINSKSYRKMLTKFRKITKVLEPYLMRKEYTFDYSKIPSKAHQKYKDAFVRNDKERYKEYSENLAKAIKSGSNDVKINAGTLYPLDIILQYFRKYGTYMVGNINDIQRSILNSSWASLRDYFNEDAKHENWLVMADVSGSMSSPKYLPIAASVSLAMYIAEHNNGIFADKYITFHSHPRFVSIDRNWTVEQRLNEVMRDNWFGSTNIDAAVNLILNAAVEHKISQEEMPTALLIISDMQFDYACTDATALDDMRRRFEKAGYKMPKIVFWNVAGQYMPNMPATKNDSGVIMFSGYSPSIINQILTAEKPETFMLNTINDKRYSCITLPE